MTVGVVNASSNSLCPANGCHRYHPITTNKPPEVLAGQPYIQGEYVVRDYWDTIEVRA